MKISDIVSFRHSNLKIGVFGGSFNPAHRGHLEISKMALMFLKLDYVFWLVAKQNPHKEHYSNSFQSRINFAKKLASENKKIIVTNFEDKIISNNSLEAIKLLKTNLPKAKLFWIMGSDCLNDFDKWFRYEIFMSEISIAIFERNGIYKSLYSKVCIKYKNNISKNLYMSNFSDIMLFRGKKHNISSSLIRRNTM